MVIDMRLQTPTTEGVAQLMAIITLIYYSTYNAVALAQLMISSGFNINNLTSNV